MLTFRLAVIKDAKAVCGAWSLESKGPVAAAIAGKAVAGRCSGVAHAALLTLPADYGNPVMMLDGKAFAAGRNGSSLALAFPAGDHTWSVKPE